MNLTNSQSADAVKSSPVDTDRNTGTGGSAIAPYFARWLPEGDARESAGLFRDRYPVRLIDGSTLELPFRPLPGALQAIALLMTNQTPFAVETAMARVLVPLARAFEPEAIVGVPTMGLDYARLVARDLGLADYVALGFSQKFWYDERLSERATSVTSPGVGKTLYLDPALLERVAGKRVVLVDDVMNTGGTAAAAIRLLARVGAKTEGLVVGLTEGNAWRQVLAAIAPEWPARVKTAGHIPMFRRRAGLWEPIPETL